MITELQARTFMESLTALSQLHGIALETEDEPIHLIRVDPLGQYTFDMATLADGDVVFENVKWTEPVDP